MDSQAWDREAASFDDDPDHGLGDPVTRAAWRELLLAVLPPAPARIVDLGCGTGTLTKLLADEGYAVDGLDFSPEMIARARLKVPEATFAVGDAADPTQELKPGSYDVVLARHVLWAMPDPAAAFTRWLELLRPHGAVVLVEGFWETGAGLTSAATERMVRTHRHNVTVRALTDSIYWGKEVHDERYLLVSPS